jgi:Leucine-rich repeat (LRR) protein
LGAVSSPLDHGDGTYTATYTGAETPGRAKITATSESGKSGTTTIQLDGVDGVDGEKSKFKIFGSAAAQTGQPVSIEVLLVTTRGAPLSRRRVDLKIEPNADVQIKSAEKTNLEGKTIITFTAGTAGIYTLKGRSGKTILDGNLAAIFTGDPVVLPEMEGVEIISIPDPALRKVLESALHKWPGGDIIREHLEDLKTLSLAGKEIRDWTGLEYCISLQQLDLSNHQLQDLTSLPWAQLTRLTQLNLSNNQISDFSLLSNLASLQSLDLSHNQIYELSALVGLTYLGQLKLNHNQISDLTPLAKLPNLTQLYLGSGQKEQQNLVRDLKPLQNLPSLQELYLSGNQINNIGPIASLPALKSLELYHNPLNKSALLIHIPALEERKVTVSHNSSAPLSTTISGGTVQNGDQEVEVELLNQKGIVLQFSDKVSPGQVELKAKEGEALTVQAKWEEDQLTLNLPANQTFGYQTTYIIRLTGVKDADGIALEGDQVTFTTKAEVRLNPTFTLSASRPQQSANPGQQATYTLSLQGVDGFEETVKLSTTQTPANVTTGFDNSSIQLKAEQDKQPAKLVLTLPEDIAVETYPFTVLATSGGLSQNISLKLKVELPPSRVASLRLQAEPDQLTADGVSTSIITVTAKDDQGRALRGETLTLLASSGQVSDLVENKETATYTATYTAGSKVEQVTLTVVARNDKKGAIKLNLIEKPKIAPSFAISSLKAEQTGNPGGYISYLVKLEGKDGFADQVTLFATDLPEGISATFDPKEISLSTEDVLHTSQMTLTVGTAVEAYDYEITVLGTSSAGSTKKLTLTAKVESTDLELSTLTLIAKPKQVLLGQGLEVLGQLVILSESAEVKPEGLTIS